MAAEQGDVKAQYRGAVCYDKGIGVKQSLSDAASWYRVAAEQRDVKAQYPVAVCYDKGIGVKSLLDAAGWYREAAEQRDAKAQYSFAVCREKCYGVTRSRVAAVSWYKKAKANGNEDAKTALSRLGEL